MVTPRELVDGFPYTSNNTILRNAHFENDTSQDTYGQASTAALLTIHISRDVALRPCVNTYRRLERSECLHIQDQAFQKEFFRLLEDQKHN
jgi:hypothetical protein